MTEQPPFDPKRRKKLVGTVLLTASVGLSVGWMMWRSWMDFCVRPQTVKPLAGMNAVLIGSVEPLTSIDWPSQLDTARRQQAAADALQNQQAMSVERLAAIEDRLAKMQDQMLRVQNFVEGTSITVDHQPVTPTRPPGEITTSDPDNQQLKLVSALDEYHVWSLNHRKAALQYQLVKDNILFVTTLIIVGFGLYLSYLQFKKVEQPEGSLKLGPAGIEITSSILGIFILAFSVGFFYLYLVHVFPIEEIGQENLPPVPAPNSEGQ